MAGKARGPRNSAERRAQPNQAETEIQASLHRLFGAVRDDEFERLVPGIAAHNSAIQSWLEASHENLEMFQRDPVSTLRRNFPDLKIPAAIPDRKRVLGDRIKISVATPAPDPAVLVLFVAVWNYLATSEENVTGFQANPVGVITSLGRGQPPSVVAAVMNAFGFSLDQGIAFGRFVHEAVKNGILDPGGPVQASVIGEVAVMEDTAPIRGR